MWKQKAKNKTMAAVVLIGLVLAMAIDAPCLHSGVCEDAFQECSGDWYNQAWGYIGTVYCLMGYAFCKKYIDP